MSRKTLKEKSVIYSNIINLYSVEENRAKILIIYGKLKLEFLKWLKTAGPGNIEFKLETEEYSINEEYPWAEAVMKFADDLTSEGFYVDIVGGVKKYSITVLFRKPLTKEEKRSLKKEFRKIRDRKMLPYTISKKIEKLFQTIFNVKYRDELYEHPKYMDYLELVSSLYKKGMSEEKLLSKLFTYDKKYKNSPINYILGK